MVGVAEEAAAPAATPRVRRSEHARHAKRSSSRLDAWPVPALVALTALVGIAITVARFPAAARHPVFYAEDGQVWFAHAYNSGAWRPLFETDAGYLQTFPRLVADVGLLLPLRWVPALFVAVAIVVQVLPACFLVTNRLERVIPSRWVRCAFALAYLLMPNSQEINANLTNAQWHLALLAFLVLIAADGGLLWRVFDMSVVVLSALTGPFAIVLAPIGLIVFLVRRRRWTAVLTVVLFCLAIVQLVAVATSGSARSHLAPLGVSVARLVEILGGQVVGGTALGPVHASAHLAGAPWLCGLLLAVGLAFVVFALWRGSMELRLLNMFGGAILLSALVSPLESPTGFQWQGLATDGGARYWFLPACALVADVMWSCGYLAARRRPLAVPAFAALACIAVVGMTNSFEYQAPGPRPDWAAETAAFAHVRPGSSYTFTGMPPGWFFTLTKH